MVDAAGFKELYNEQLRNEGNPEFDFTPWTGNTDWQDEIFQTGFITNNNVSITGASARHSFYLGAVMPTNKAISSTRSIARSH